MNYKKALQLQEAGFPQKDETLRNAPDTPTLEEVIEELGDNKFELIRAQAGWLARTRGCVVHMNKTPLEAVSNLYIKLNNK